MTTTTSPDALQIAEQLDDENRRCHNGGHRLLRAAAASLRASSAPAQEAQPVATLHDDGYYTFKPGMEPAGARHAGWRLDVYAGSPPSAPAPQSDAMAMLKRLLKACTRRPPTTVREADADGAAFDALIKQVRAFVEQAPSAPAVPDELARIKALLKDPAVVHAALIRGEIAKPDIRAMLHAYGSDALDRWDSAHKPKAAAPSVDALRDAMQAYLKTESGDAGSFSGGSQVVLLDDAFYAVGQLHAAAQTAQAAEPAKLFAVDVLGNPMRERQPGKWEVAQWPSERAAEPAEYLLPVEGPNGTIIRKRRADLTEDDRIVFDGPDAFASSEAFQARMDAEIEAAGGIEAWRAAWLARRNRIREIFMAHGFTIKEGQTDLKDYVYEAAEALFRAAEPAEALRKDTERLDWLIKSDWYVGPWPDGDIYGVRLDDRGHELRAAIDDALAGASRKEVKA